MDERNDGWNEAVQSSLYDVFGKLEKLMYEVRHCKTSDGVCFEP